MKDNKGGFSIQTLLFKGSEWIKIDDVIKWIKENHTSPDDAITLHWLIKTFVKLKNTKP